MRQCPCQLRLSDRIGDFQRDSKMLLESQNGFVLLLDSISRIRMKVKLKMVRQY